MSKSHLFLGAAAFAVAISVSQPVFAQDAAPAAPEAECVDDNNNGVCDADETAGRQIVVTGSRIARPTLDSPTPLTSVSVGELTDDGSVSLGDALNDLPSLRSTFSSGNSSRFIGTAGLNFLDLRGLGTTRTLVLVNGKRHITASAGDYRIDVNTIPIDLLERVDIVTGGNSAVYGSDAVAGVVNFILKRDFEGFEADAQAGISSRGDRATYAASLTWGRNFADGRGNIALSAEYSRQEPLLLRDRDELTGAFSGRCQYQVTEVTTGEPAAGDGISDTTFLCGIVNASISDGGTVGALGGGRFLRFRDDGTLFTDSPTTDFSAFGSGFQQGGGGSTLSKTGSLLAGLDRATFNLLAHFDVSDAFRPYVEAKYVRVEATGEGQASFFTSVPGTLGGPAFRCNNGFLAPQALTTLQGLGLCANVATGTFPLARFNTDLGGRGFDGSRETYRVVAGVEGDFNEDWRYEVFANYGTFTTKGNNTNNLLLFTQDGLAFDGFNLAIDAAIAAPTFTGTNFVNNAAGQRVVCRINEVTNVNPNCVPLNLFGEGNADPRARAFIRSDGTILEKATQFNAGGFVSGDLSQLFELPGGPIGFVIGAEYRSESSSVEYDELTKSGATFLNALSDFDPPKLTVKEAYGEIQIPLLKDMPFAEELTLSAAGRVSDYNTATGTVYAYNLQGIYAPIPDIRLRGSYATSVRAPTQGDLFATPGENFAQLTDPCDSINIGTNPNRAANCAAAGVPTTLNAAAVAACATSAVPAPDRELGDPFRNCPAVTSGTSFLQGGNPTLVEERGKSLTLGAVFEPSFIPGLNFTVDYYNIEVKNLIATLLAQTIINNCYDNPGGINNSFCATVNRDPATGFFAAPAVISGGVNFARQKAEGIDFDIAYRKTFENGHRVSLRAIATRVLRFDNYLDPARPLEPNRQLSELGDPKWNANLNASYDFGALRLSYGLRYIGKQTILTYETQNPYKGQCPTSGITPNTGGINGAAVPCTAGTIITIAPNNADARPRIFYPDAFYHTFRADIEVNNKFNFYVGVDNAFDRQPPLGLLGTAGGDPYDTFGRYFFAGITAEF
ncbi:MAG: TonB-dependent receptor [Sphingopyxis sp.]|nr:TonB-dependent receptor [Sphingopyxis sp.]